MIKKSKFSNNVSDMVKKLSCIGISDWSDGIEGPEDMVDLAVGQPDITPSMNVIRELYNSAKDGMNGYQDSQGIEGLRDKITNKYMFEKMNYDVCITAGTTAALFLALATCFNAGDEILLVEPYFPQYLELLKIHNLSVGFIETERDFSISLDMIANSISDHTKGIILNYPNNPTGALLGFEELDKIVQYCEQRNIYVIFDNIYSEYIYRDSDRIGNVHMRENLIYINGFSKSLRVTGWRIGFAIANRELIHYMSELQAQLYQCVSAPVQYSIYKTFDMDISSVINEYRERMDFVQENLACDYERASGGGGFFVYARIPQYYEGTATDFCILAKKNGVHLVPGKLFSRSDTHFRISICVSREQLMIAVEQLNRLAVEIKISSVAQYIENLVGRVPKLVGSMGMGIDIDSSDIDFAIPFYNEDDENKIVELLKCSGIEFRGKRISTATSHRYLFSFYWKQNFIDIVVLNENDYANLVTGIDRAYFELSIYEKKKIKEEKEKLSSRSVEDYEQYKLEVYKRFCPELLWLTDIDICKLLVKEYCNSGKSDDIPLWLKDKIVEYDFDMND